MNWSQFNWNVLTTGLCLIFAVPTLAADPTFSSGSTKSWILYVDADGDATPTPGDTIRYTINVVNSGDQVGTIDITDPIPDEASSWTLVSAANGTDASSSTILEVNQVSVPSGSNQDVIFDVVLAVVQDETPMTNVATYSAPLEGGEGGSLVAPDVVIRFDTDGDGVYDNDELEVSKTATTSYTRTYSWDINKDVTPTSHTGFAGDSFASGYTVSVDQTIEDSDWNVSGTISVSNLTSNEITVSVSDSNGSEAATLDCGGSLVVPANGSAECAYSINLPSGTDGVNTATVSYNGIDYPGVAAYQFGEPTTIIGYDSIYVTDTNGSSWQASGDTSWTYDAPFDCPTDLSLYADGIYSFTSDNTATITNTGHSDSESVDLTCFAPASVSVVKTTIEGPEDIGQFPFEFYLINPNGAYVETKTLNSSGTVIFNTQLTTEGSWIIREFSPEGWVSNPQECSFDISFPEDAGQTHECSFHNTEMSRVELLKLTDGIGSSTEEWTFNIYEGPDGFGGEPVTTESTPPVQLFFGYTNLDPTMNYTICEIGVPAGFSTKWKVDSSGDGIADMIIDPYNPNANDDPPEDLGNRCFDIGDSTSYPLTPGDKLVFEVDNSSPGGDPRSPGYWKNWNTCTDGNQPDTADINGGPDAGWFIVDDILNDPGITWDDFNILTCEDGVNILDQRDLNSGKKRASDAAYTLAMHLMAAQLNLAAGAETCPSVLDVVVEAENLLVSIGFDGTVKYLRPKDALYEDALDLAYILDEYNNGLLCVDTLPQLLCDSLLEQCDELVPFEPDAGEGYIDYHINGETIDNQYRSYIRRDVMYAVKYAAAKTSRQSTNWPEGNSAPVGLGDMSESDGSIPGTSIGAPGHPAGTHEYGLDIDLSYYQLSSSPDNFFRTVCSSDGYSCVSEPDILDSQRTAFFMASIAEHPNLRAIVVDPLIEPVLISTLDSFLNDGTLSAEIINTTKSKIITDNFYYQMMHISFLP